MKIETNRKIQTHRKKEKTKRKKHTERMNIHTGKRKPIKKEETQKERDTCKLYKLEFLRGSYI